MFHTVAVSMRSKLFGNSVTHYFFDVYMADNAAHALELARDNFLVPVIVDYVSTGDIGLELIARTYRARDMWRLMRHYKQYGIPANAS